MTDWLSSLPTLQTVSSDKGAIMVKSTYLLDNEDDMIDYVLSTGSRLPTHPFDTKYTLYHHTTYPINTPFQVFCNANF